MKQLLKRMWWLLPVLAMVALMLLPPDLMGRPGGGHSSSGGSSGGGGSYGGGGGGGGDDAIGLIILIVRYPYIGIPLLVIIVLYRIYANRRAAPETTITTHSGTETQVWNRRKVDNALWDFRQERDPEFSQTLFLDFAQHLYHQYHYHRTKSEVVNLRPYFKDEIIENAAPKSNFQIDVTELVINGVDFVNLYDGEAETTISVSFDTNYTETIDGHSNRWWVQETWFFTRKASLCSPSPAALQSPGCPNCGAGLELSPTGECSQCKTVVPPGSKTWFVMAINIAHREVQHGDVVGTYAPEQGTNLPTLYDPRLGNLGRIFVEQHKIESITEYEATFKEKIAEPIFKTIYRSWAERKYEPARPLMSDNLFRSHLYWVETYKAHKRINHLDNLTITGIHLVKLDLDKYYEAATVRIFANVLDYLTDESGKLVAGNNRKPRAFSEYWTFVRRTGVESDDKKFNPDCCPNCGAPVNMGMSGICSFCNSKVTTGEFGWILSRITQDEAYFG